MARGLKFRIYEVKGLYYLCSEKQKVQISCAVTAQLICAFVFPYANSRLSHDTAHVLFSGSKYMYQTNLLAY